jgi:hypothetical protein
MTRLRGKLPATVQANPLLGTWKLRSHVVTSATGQRSTPYGEEPKGYLSYTADGRMQVIGAAHRRSAPAALLPSERERIELYDTMFAYAGTYSIEGATVIHHVDLSWNEIWTGTEQRRQFELRGNTLTLTTHIGDPTTGAETCYSLVWERLPT